MVHPVDGGGAEQRLGGGDQGEGDDRAEPGGADEGGQGVAVGQLHDVEQPGHPDPGDGQVRGGGDGGGQPDGGQRRGDGAGGALRQVLPADQHQQGAEAEGGRARGGRGGEDVRQQGGQSGDLLRPGRGGAAVGECVELAEHQGQSDAGQHAVHHRGGHRPEPAAEPQGAHRQLEQAGGEHQQAERAGAELPDGVGDQDGQSGGGPADLQAAAGQGADHQAADDAGDQTEFGRDAGGDGHPDAEREGDQEHHE